MPATFEVVPSLILFRVILEVHILYNYTNPVHVLMYIYDAFLQ